MAPDGDLSSFLDEDIEDGAGWDGEPGLFIKSAIKNRLLDEIEGVGYIVHDWGDYAEKLKSRVRKRNERARKKRDSHGDSHKNDNPNVTVTLTDRPTRPTDQTDRPTSAREEVPNPEPEAEHPPKPEHPLDIPPDDHLEFDASRLAEIIDVVRRAHQMTAYRPKLTDYDKRQDAVNEIIAIAEDEKVDPEAVAGISYRNYIETKDRWLHNAGYPLGAWVQKVGHYYRPPEPFKEPEEPPEPSRKAVYDRDTAEFERKAKEAMERYRQENPEERDQAMAGAKNIIEEIKNKTKLNT